LRYFLLVAFVAALLLTISCRRNNTEFVTVALPEKFTTLDTLTSTASDSAADRVRNLIFNTLVRKNESFDYVGELAQDISVSPDGMTVTFNLRDFPEPALKPYDVTAIHPDDFLLDQLDLHPALVVEVLQEQAASYRREPTTVAGLLPLLDRTGLPRFAAEARRHLR